MSAFLRQMQHHHRQLAEQVRAMRNSVAAGLDQRTDHIAHMRAQLTTIHDRIHQLEILDAAAARDHRSFACDIEREIANLDADLQKSLQRLADLDATLAQLDTDLNEVDRMLAAEAGPQ